MSTKHHNGTVAEFTVAAHYAQAGWLVYWPTAAQSPCDFVAIRGQDVRRVQVKKATWHTVGNSDYLQARVIKDTRSIRKRLGYTVEDCDVIAFVDEHRVWVAPVAEAGHRTCVHLDKRCRGNSYAKARDYDPSTWLNQF